MSDYQSLEELRAAIQREGQENGAWMARMTAEREAFFQSLDLPDRIVARQRYLDFLSSLGGKPAAPVADGKPREVTVHIKHEPVASTQVEGAEHG